MAMPLLTDGDYPDQSVIFTPIHPMAGDGFEYISASVDQIYIDDTSLEMLQKTGASNNNGPPPLILKYPPTDASAAFTSVILPQ